MTAGGDHARNDGDSAQGDPNGAARQTPSKSETRFSPQTHAAELEKNGTIAKLAALDELSRNLWIDGTAHKRNFNATETRQFRSDVTKRVTAQLKLRNGVAADPEVVHQGPEVTPLQGPAEQAWPDLIPFSQPADLPPFPLHVLPPVLRTMVEETVASVDVAPEVPAMLGIAVAAAAAAGGFEVDVGGTHVEVIAVWPVSIAESGERKTQAFERMSAPIVHWERAVMAEHRLTVATVQAAQACHDIELREVRRQLARESDEGARRRLKERHDALVAAPPEISPSPEITCEDTTPPALAQRMAGQFGRAAILDDEGGALANILARHSQGGANVDIYLKGHAGGMVKVDRVDRVDFIERAVLCLGLAAQPAALDAFRNNAHLRGVGLLARFLFWRAQGLAGSRPYRNRKVDPEIAARYDAHVQAALTASLSRARAGKPGMLRIEGAALEVWKKAYDHFEGQMADGQPLASFRDWGSKAAGAVARIAGAFHVLEHGDRAEALPIAPETVASAAEIMYGLAPHATAILGSLEASPAENDAIDILGWIRRHGFREFSEAKLHEHRRAMTPERREAALSVLERRRYVRSRPSARTGRPGRPATIAWDVNPAVFATGTPSSNNSINSGNEAKQADTPNTLNCLNVGSPDAARVGALTRATDEKNSRRTATKPEGTCRKPRVGTPPEQPAMPSRKSSDNPDREPAAPATSQPRLNVTRRGRLEPVGTPDDEQPLLPGFEAFLSNGQAGPQRAPEHGPFPEPDHDQKDEQREPVTATKVLPPAPSPEATPGETNVDSNKNEIDERPDGDADTVTQALAATGVTANQGRRAKDARNLRLKPIQPTEEVTAPPPALAPVAREETAPTGDDPEVEVAL